MSSSSRGSKSRKKSTTGKTKGETERNTSQSRVRNPESERFSEIKKRSIEISKELKKGGLSAVKKRRLEEELGELNTERAETVNALFKSWLASKDMVGKNELDVLGEYGNNWFKLKDDLAYVKDDESDDDYEMKLAVLEKVLNFRKIEVDQLLDETLVEIRKEIGGEIEGININALALGSVTPTSDYDVTFLISDNPEFEHRCVKYFNEKFLERFGVPSGILFDTNVYTNGFMPYDEEDGGLVYLDDFNPSGITDLTKDEQDIIRKGEKDKRQTQLALSLVAIKQALTQETEFLDGEAIWRDFKKDIEEEVGAKVNEKSLPKVKGDLAAIFREVSLLERVTNGNIVAKKIKLGDRFEGEAQVESASKDALYVEELTKVAELVKSLQKNKEDLAKGNLTSIARKQLLEERSSLITEYETSQGKALIYANEAYYSAGAAIHVVKAMQGGSTLVLSKEQKIESILMNIGYKIAHFAQQYKENGFGRALIGTSKYGQRIGNLVNAETQEESDQQLFRDVLETRDLTDIPKLLEFEEELVRDFKKNDEKYPTPSEKEAAAEAEWRERYAIENKKGELVDDEIRVVSSFLQIAIKSFSPFYLEEIDKLGVAALLKAKI